MGSLTDPAIDSLTFAVPFGVTDSARVNIIALDAYGNSGLDTTPDFIVTDNTPPSLEYKTLTESMPILSSASQRTVSNSYSGMK